MQFGEQEEGSGRLRWAFEEGGGWDSAGPRDTLARVSAHDPQDPRVVAIYRPHYYPEAALAAEFGPGWSDWRRVAEAVPLFPGHEQPRQPWDLGYCDLRVPEVRRAQADLARAYGVDAFCYGHYWFEGRRLFERPFAEVLASGAPDFPFCLCWVNEDWQRPWIAQTYSRRDDLVHAAFLAEAFADPRYLRVAGRPVFVVRRPEALDDSVATLAAIRAAAAARGVGEPWLLGAEEVTASAQARDRGFDATLDWPHPGLAPRPPAHDGEGLLRRALTNLVRWRRWLPRLAIAREARRRARLQPAAAGRIAVTAVGWDDTPTRGSLGAVLVARSPLLFEQALRAALLRARSAPAGERLVFIEAWNAWSEGASLEPDRRFGRAYLASVARARIGASLPAGSAAG